MSSANRPKQSPVASGKQALRLPLQLESFLRRAHVIQREDFLGWASDECTEELVAEYVERSNRFMKAKEPDSKDLAYCASLINQVFSTSAGKSIEYHNRFDVISGVEVALGLLAVIRRYRHPKESLSYCSILDLDQRSLESRVCGPDRQFFEHWPAQFRPSKPDFLFSSWARIESPEAGDSARYAASLSAVNQFLRACRHLGREQALLAGFEQSALGRVRDAENPMDKELLTQGLALMARTAKFTSDCLAQATFDGRLRVATLTLEYHGIDPSSLNQDATRVLHNSATLLSGRLLDRAAPEPHRFVPLAEQFVDRIVAASDGLAPTVSTGSSLGLA